ncbi:MAG: 16S rRNA (cytosine(1402)-N(4))-methyltransferase RsmH, partial [candidate division Zixibacteria bacterium]|nr:16S rRNA (cytosine(1402)-N(4))-methyltransferase RsmH [candidate division Zixibacteria bacterium]
MTLIIGRRNNGYHRPVLVEEAVNFLVTRCDGVYLDLTCGGGGHLKYLSDKLSPAAILVGIDRDPEAISATKENLKSIPQFTRILKGDFCRFDEMARTLELDKIDGILLDLGLSSHQLDSAERGFAYMQDGPLDMRMGREDDLTAEVVINSYSETELGLLFKEFGEEKRAKIAAWTICRERIKGEIKTTAQLRRVLESVLPARD